MINPNCIAFVSSRDLALAAWSTAISGQRAIVYARTIPAEYLQPTRRCEERWIASARPVDVRSLAPMTPVRLRRTLRQVLRRAVRRAVRKLTPLSDMEYQLREYRVYRLTHTSPPCGT